MGLPVVGLLLRFGMRALGVRTELPLPGFVYSVTAPLVEPFYRFFPANPRFDTSALEAASLIAACALFLVAVMVYVLVVALTYLRDVGFLGATLPR